MTEMTKKVKSPTWEQLPEVYGLAVIIVICVIGVRPKLGDYSNPQILHILKQWTHK